MKTIYSWMKGIGFAFICLLSIATSFAQERKPDVIIKKDNTKIETVIQEIDKAAIKYKKFSDPSGPVFTIEKSEVISILYGNGEVEVVSQSNDIDLKSNAAGSSTLLKKKNVNTPTDISSLSPKKQKFIAQYQYTSSEKIIQDLKKYKRRSTTGKIVGTTFATAGLATIIVGIMNYSSADKKADNHFSQADPMRLFYRGYDGDDRWNGVLLPSVSELGLDSDLANIGDGRDPDRLSKLAAVHYKYKERVIPWYADQLRKDNMKITLLGVGVGGIATAVYLMGASAGWKYRLLQQEVRSKGLSFKIEPQWRPNQRMAGLRLVGAF